MTDSFGTRNAAPASTGRSCSSPSATMRTGIVGGVIAIL